MSSPNNAPLATVAIPANLDVEEKLAGPFTSRQSLILAATAAVVLAVGEVARRTAHCSPLTLAGCTAPLIFAGLVLAVVKPGGVPADALLASGARYLHAGRRHANAPDRTSLPPRTKRLRPLYKSITGHDDIGIVELDGGEVAVVLEVEPVCLDLIDAAEATDALSALGQILATQTGPATTSTVTVRIDLTEHAEAAAGLAAQLPTPQLRELALAQAGHLRELAEDRQLWQRRHLITVRHTGPGAQSVASNRARALADALSASGINAAVLNPAELTGLLLTACDPQRTHSVAALAPPDEPVTALPFAAASWIAGVES